jgi:hypothetical protein
MEAAGFYLKLLQILRTTQHHIPEDNDLGRFLSFYSGTVQNSGLLESDAVMLA